MEQSTYNKTSAMEEQGIRSTPTNDVKVANKKTVRCTDFIIRSLALATTLVAVIIMAVGKETKIVPVLLPNLPVPINAEVHAKWQYSSAFVYFMVVNIIACIYAAISLIVSVGNLLGSKSNLTVIILDVIMVALLFSGNGAAGAVGVIGYKGNSHTQWRKVCNTFDNYCRHTAASIALSLIGSLMFILLLLLATSRLHKRSH